MRFNLQSGIQRAKANFSGRQMHPNMMNATNGFMTMASRNDTTEERITWP